MVTYSHSRLSAFEQCPLKFKFKYIDRLIPDIKQSIEGFLGNKVHETLEWVYNESMKNNLLTLDQVLEFYARIWNKDFDSEIKITNPEQNSEFYFNKGIKFLLDYYLKHTPFKDNTIATERQIVVELDKESRYIIQGYVDRLVFHKEKGIFEIHDYKTSASMKTQEELDHDRQLALYSIGIKKQFENIQEIILVWHFLDFNKTIISKRTEEELELLKKEIISLIDEIESTKEFLPKPSSLCKWCEFQSYCTHKQV